jgi:hypothetical protein
MSTGPGGVIGAFLGALITWPVADATTLETVGRSTRYHNVLGPVATSAMWTNVLWGAFVGAAIGAALWYVATDIRKTVRARKSSPQ